MKVKYDEAFEPLRNKHHGFTFIPSNYGNPAMSGQKNDRKRFTYQWFRMQCNQKAVTQWRNMSAATKSAWETFAATYPQPSKKDPNVFLSGYQLFIKRNTYKFLHDGIDSEFIEIPELSELPNPNFSAEINENGMCLDVTEWYIKNFGILPEVGQFLICRIVPMAVNSGQFFAPLIATLEVQEVFIDGLFLSLFFNGHAPGVVFSVYLSKPVHAGRAYPSTKFRYMGCFKPTQFIQLTDTPDSYEGQAGKFVAVKETEDGLEFVEGGGGGVTCEDLINCDLIQQMIDQISANSEIISEEFNTSVPPVRYGLLYNKYCVFSPLGFSSSADWRLTTKPELDALRTYLGGSSEAGGHMKIDSLDFWVSLSSMQDNAAKTNCKGSGNRLVGGNFSNIAQLFDFWTSTEVGSSSCYGGRLSYNSNDLIRISFPNIMGLNVMLCREAPGVPDGTPGTYTGNNGRVYRTVVVNELELTADPMAETKYRDGSAIPEVTLAADWIALSTGALCAYNNNWVYV